MNFERRFSLEEARFELPTLKALLGQANAELDELFLSVKRANDDYATAEQLLESVQTDTSSASSLESLRKNRAKFQEAIGELEREQKRYLNRLNHWVEAISARGVVIRNLREGLLDFPAQQDGFEFFLCWRMDEDDISHWHLLEDGFGGRKPLRLLNDYARS